MTARRIVILMHDFPAGGTERVIIRLANLWAARGRDVLILCGDDRGPARDRVSAGVRVQRVSPAIPRGPFSRWRLGRAVARLLREEEADVIVAPGNFHIPVIRAVGGSTAPIVCNISNPLSARPRSRMAAALFGWGLKRAARHVRLFVTMSPALAADAALMLPDAAMTTIPSPIAVERNDIVGARAPATGPRILLAGRLVPQKRIDLALRTLAEGSLTEATLTIAGDGPGRAGLEALAAELGIADRVSFLGHVGDIGPCLAGADVLLLTSAYEGYPSVLVEALLAGVPVVSTGCSPAVSEIVCHPSFGRTAGPDPASLAIAIRDVSSSPQVDPDARAALAERHRPERVADEWLALLDAVSAAG